MNKYFKIVCLTLSMGVGFGFSNIAIADGHSVMFASWGGGFQDALRSTMLTPAAQKLGIEVEEDTTNGIQDVRSQISAGSIFPVIRSSNLAPILINKSQSCIALLAS